ncbi:hypothetical protein D0U04_29980 [Bacillus clarus]|uniref:Putative membrane protein n=1 Tax=Bacillus clarus TaxID=2338372 RepID=A0A090YK17_9BACI|nr:hypothetical protein [Bacillus clarus]KFM98819.1 putative membrane protein [Bacillus clarus]RFT61734.1 hypothetical protein D0U04_29980 [Bacillus clarus]
MNHLNQLIGILLGLIMYLCIIISIKIGDNTYIGDYFFKLFNINNNKFIVALTFFVCLWIVGKIFKEKQAIWLNWGRLFLTGLMLVALVSYLVM